MVFDGSESIRSGLERPRRVLLQIWKIGFFIWGRIRPLGGVLQDCFPDFLGASDRLKCWFCTILRWFQFKHTGPPLWYFSGENLKPRFFNVNDFVTKIHF